MGNVRLLLEDHVEAPATVITASTEASDMPAGNLKIQNPRSPLRITTLSGASIKFDFGEPRSINTLGLIGCNLTAVANLIRNAGDPTAATWTKSNLTPATTSSVADPNNGLMAYTLTDSSDGGTPTVHSMYPTLTVPGVAASFKLEVDVRKDTLTQVFVQVGDNANAGAATDFARVIFDIDSNTVVSSASSGFTGLTAEPGEDLGNSWLRVTLRATTSTDTTLYAHIATAKGGTANYAGTGQRLFFYRARFRWDEDATTVTVPTTGDAEGAVVRWRLARSEATLASNPLYDSGPLMGALEDDLTDWRRINHWHTLTETKARWAQVDLTDPNNADGFLDLGRVMAGAALVPEINRAWGVQASWLEPELSQRAREVQLELGALSEDEAWDDIFEPLRKRGSERGVMVIDAAAPLTDKAHRRGFYGRLAQLPPIVERRGLTTEGGTRWTHRFRIQEWTP